MLTSNHSKMLGAIAGQRTDFVDRVRSVRQAERLRLALEHAELTHEAELVLDMTYDFGTTEAQATAEAVYDLLHDDDERIWLVTEADVEALLAGHDEDKGLPGSPGWGTALDAADFFGGFSIRTR